ncbi:DUF1552 domain-containing protein [Roseimaritima sediminicola]|uniref:DUF1552 domain-containing protein n=1 Tax=Roseimaritima sediminicola TaxID=2662066 RepID=UPI0012984D7C|nr:DUF1552 domain-containing protein [Roseimaritima sediminicola]
MSQLNLKRRTFLRGAGALVGLPLLDAMLPSVQGVAQAAAGTPATAPTRMACIFFPNGAIMPDWTPQGQGRDWQLSKTLKPLEPFKSKLNVISGLALDQGRAHGDGAGDHARCSATFLTAAHPVKTASNIYVGVSVDQVAARQLEGQTKLSSIELGLTTSRNAGSCDSGYSCAYSSNISWRSPTQPMSKEVTPKAAFERLFGNGDVKGRRERDFYRQSVLDVVASDAKALLKRAGGSDKRKIDEYFSSVRDLERRIELTEAEERAAMPDLKVPDGRPETFREHARLMYDIMVLGFQTDSTRVATLMLDNAGGNRVYKEAGVNDAHHALSHHRNHADKVKSLSIIDHYLVEQFAYFLEKMDSVSEGTGTLLDHSMVMYGSGISDGNRHQHHELPIVFAGGAGGQFRTGEHIVRKEETPMANLFLTMLDTLGTPAESIGDSTGRFTDILA